MREWARAERRECVHDVPIRSVELDRGARLHGDLRCVVESEKRELGEIWLRRPPYLGSYPGSGRPRAPSARVSVTNVTEINRRNAEAPIDESTRKDERVDDSLSFHRSKNGTGESHVQSGWR